MAQSALSLIDANNCNIHLRAMALIDTIVAIRNLNTTSIFETAEDRTLFDGLKLSGLVHTALSPSALVRIRYICLLTDEAIQVRFRLDVSADLMTESTGNADTEANMLCRSVLLDSNMLTSRESPYPALLFTHGAVKAMYEEHCSFATSLWAHLEDPNLD